MHATVKSARLNRLWSDQPSNGLSSSALLRGTLDVGPLSEAPSFFLYRDRVLDLTANIPDDDDIFGDGMIVSAAEVPVSGVDGMEEVGGDALNAGYMTADEDGALGIHTPDQHDGAVVVPSEEYIREGNTVAPDGSPLTPNQIAKPHLFRAGDPKRPTSGMKAGAANRINVREMVTNLVNETNLNPIEVLFYIMNADDESRFRLGLRKSDRISANLRAKCAQELLTYMAPKLKSVEVKAKGGDSEEKGVQIFLPKNSREHGQLTQKPALVLPIGEDGVAIPFSPELADQLIRLDDDEDSAAANWPDEDGEE